jgi:CheY-like chemotaxis protein
MNQVLIEALLQKFGHQVTIVNNGREAVETVRHGTFDLILMDMEMPVMDGPTATRAIRALGGRLRTIPIVALSANAMDTEIARCRAAGMNAHVAKPIHQATLLRTLEEWIGVAAAAPATGPVLDDSKFVELERLLGHERVKEFADELRDRLQRFGSGLSGAVDRAKLEIEAHDMVSAAGNFGFDEMMGRARALMTSLRNGVDDVDALTAAARDAATRALTALEERYPAAAGARAAR